MFKVVNLDLNDEFGYICFQYNKEKINILNMEFRFKDMTRYAVNAYKSVTNYSIGNNEGLSEVRFNLNDLIDKIKNENLNNQLVWIYIETSNGYKELEIPKELISKVKELKPASIGKFAKLNFILSGSNKLSITIKRNNVNQYLKSMRRSKDQFIIELEEQQNVQEVKLKKRTFKDTIVYSEELSLEFNGQNTYSLSIEKLNQFNYSEVTNLDFIIVMKDKDVLIDVPLLKKNQLDLVDLSFSDSYISKLYFTAKNSLSLRIERKYESVHVDIMELLEDKIYSKIKVTHPLLDGKQLQDIKCSIYRRNKLFNDFDYIQFNLLSVKREDDYLIVEVPLDELFGNINTNYEQDYEIFLEIENKKMKLINNFSQQIKCENSIYFVKTEKSFLITVKPVNDNAVKISILGSCFSRAAFNSSHEYFNKDYKYYFSLEYSHFWISLISAVAEKIPFPAENYKDIPEKSIGNVRKEYDKSTFSDLNKIETDYVIIDLFVDAVHGVRVFNDGKYIGQNGDLHKSSYYKNKFLKETSQFDNRHPEFWEVWRNSCDIFIERLGEVIDKKKVILNWGSLSDSYYNEKKEISSFNKDKKFNKADVNFINRTWEKMNNYFITKMPEAKIIDVNKYNYHADVEYPYGGSGPHHYERGYYRSLLGELAKIVVKDTSR